ncbi:glycosyl hydrolase family 28-related protein [Ralstonia insidiosa]|uniref:glycosyl hydrolase family 28-related protein n=1 Tax=Ralstonia insidiosa TaxID=190721 RepID=UPI001427E88F|nr:hypothetical protein [Ralstonia insidiosa]
MATSVFLSPSPILQFFDNSGRPNVGGSVLTQVGGVNYPTYQDSNGNTPLPNPIPLNSRGEISNSSGVSCQLFLAAGVTYVFTQFDANGNQINQAQWMSPGGIFSDGSINKVVDSIAALRLLSHQSYTRAFVTGYYAVGDGGGGNYYYDPSDTTSSDNGGSIIVATDGARWKLTSIQWLSVKQFGAKGDGVTDDTVAIQNCYNAVPAGGTMYIPEALGLFYVCSKQGSNAYVFNFSRFVNIKADGLLSALNPASGTTVNTVYLQPAVNVGYWGMKWDGLSLGNPTNGVLNGLNGIFIDTQIANSQLPAAIFTNLNIQKGNQGGVGILHINNSSNNVNGGMYGCIFADSIVQNGFSLQNSGDSVHIERNIISGNGIGIYASLTSGASELTIIGNNITTNGGQIRIDSGSRFRILNNNIEQQVATTGSTLMIYIAGTNGTMVNGEIRGNHLGAFTGSNMTANIQLGANALGTTIDDNTMLNSNAGFVGPCIFDQGTQTRIGFNEYGTNITTTISPAGTGCMGVAKTLTLQNGWVTFNASKAPYVFKDANGIVSIVGIIASGTVTANTVLFTLPDANYYPQQLLRFAVPSNNGASAIHGEIQIDTSGNVTIQTGGSPYLGITVSFPAANAGQIASNL